MVEFALESGCTLEAEARVVECFPDPDGDGELCSLALEWDSEAEQQAWEEEVDQLLHPRTRRSGTWASSLWELYDRSGYFQLSGKSPAHFAHLRGQFAVVSRRLDVAPHLGCQIVWASDRGAEAALSLLNLYSGTTMVSQVARRKDEPSPASARQMLRDINLHALDQIRRNPSLRWILVYVQEGGARWSRLAYQSFSEARQSTGESCVLPFRAMETTSSRTGLRAEPFAISPATTRELSLLIAAAARVRPAAYLDATDLVPERIDFRQTREAWAEVGFEREREILVAHRQNEPVACAVVESGQDALHLFGLLNSVRFFALTPRGVEAIPALIEASRAWYRARERERFVCFFEDELLPYAEQPALKDLGAANLMAFSTKLLPDFLEHLYLITTPRIEGGAAS